MRSLRFSFYISLGAHALLLGAIVLGGLAWHEPRLPGGGSPTPQVLTIIGLPDEPPAEAISQPAPDALSVSVANLQPVPLSTPAAPPPLVSIAPPLVLAAPPPDTLAGPASLVQPVVAAQPAPAAALPSAVSSPAPSASALPSTGTPGPNAVPSDPVVSQSGGSSVAQGGSGEVRARPDYRRNPEPAYPLSARRHRQEGLVLLRVTVTAKGRAARVELKESSGFPTLDEAAMHAVREWEFEPARVGPLPVESEIEVPVRFKMTP